MDEIVSDTDLETVINWISLIKAMLILLFGWVVAKLATRFFMGFAEFKLSKHQLSIYKRFIFYAIIVLFIATALHQLGFKISVLLGAAGILTVALGFASQTSASNLISGLFLLAEKPFQIGDVLKVDGDTGEVISIDLLSVKLRTFDNLYVRIPNEQLIKSKFVNITKFPIRRIDLAIGVAYRESLERVSKLLLELADKDPRCLEEPQPFCIIKEFGNSSVNIQLSVWGRREVYRNLKSDLMLAIKTAFDDNDIEIPFPHVSLYTGSKTEPFPITQVNDQRNVTDREPG